MKTLELNQMESLQKSEVLEGFFTGFALAISVSIIGAAEYGRMGQNYNNWSY